MEVFQRCLEGGKKKKITYIFRRLSTFTQASPPSSVLSTERAMKRVESLCLQAQQRAGTTTARGREVPGPRAGRSQWRWGRSSGRKCARAEEEA